MVREIKVYEERNSDDLMGVYHVVEEQGRVMEASKRKQRNKTVKVTVYYIICSLIFCLWRRQPELYNPRKKEISVKGYIFISFHSFLCFFLLLKKSGVVDLDITGTRVSADKHLSPFSFFFTHSNHIYNCFQLTENSQHKITSLSVYNIHCHWNFFI